MPQVNRYSQMPAPLLVNPMSFEELSRVPLAKAQEKAEGIAALNRIDTDYSVDAKDLNYINSIMKTVTDAKDNLVNNIASNGIDSQTVADVINLKKQRDNLYKNQITQAEENKKKIDIWRQSVDEMVLKGQIPGWYGEKIKQKEYNNRWQGTFTPEGTPTPFINTYGERFYDEDEDIKNIFKQAEDMTQVGYKYSGGSAPSVSNIGGINFLRTISPAEWQKMSNKQKIAAAKQMLWEQYTDPSTERGRYAQYADYGENEYMSLANKLDKYEQMYVKEQENKQGGEAHYGDAPVQNTGNTAYVAQDFRPSKYQPSSVLNEAEPGFFSKIVQGYKETNKDVNSTKEGFWSHLNPFRGFKLIKEFVSNMGDTPETVSKKRQAIKQYNLTVQQLVKDGVLDPATVFLATSGGSNTDKYVKQVFDAIDDYQDENTSFKEAPNIVTEDYMRTTFGLSNEKVSPEKAAEDILKEAPNFVKLEDREVVDAKDKEHEEIMKAIASNKAEVQGVIPMLSPDLLDEKGNYMDNMSSARVVYVRDKDSDYFGKKYYVKLPEYLRKNNPNFERIEELNRKILSLPTSESTDLFIAGKNGLEQVKVKHNDAKPGTYLLIRKGDPTYYDLTDNELTRMYGEEWLNKYASKKK